MPILNFELVNTTAMSCSAIKSSLSNSHGFESKEASKSFAPAPTTATTCVFTLFIEIKAQYEGGDVREKEKLR